MAREKAQMVRKAKLATPTLEVFDVFHQTVTSVTTAAEAIPNTNLSQRKGMFIQNLTNSDVYVGGCKPHLIKSGTGLQSINATRKYVKWTKSGSGTNEYYASVVSQGGDPSLTEPKIMYGILSDGGSETLLVNGTVGSLNDHEWDWGNNDSLGYNTIYFADATGDPDSLAYISLISYWRVPDGSSQYGLHLAQYDSMFVTCDGSARVFAYASATSNIVTVEV